MNKVATITPNEATSVSAMALVSAAIEKGADVGQVDKLIDLVKFNDEREALKAFNQAFTKAQAEFPSVLKTKEGHNSKYASFSDVVFAVRPVLDKHGMSFRHTVCESDKGVTVTCVLAHESGHSESTALTAPPDTSGSKNAIQSIGSSLSYLKRYTLEAVTGVVTTDDDTDGSLDQNMFVTSEQAANLQSLSTEVGANEGKLFNFFSASGFSKIKADDYGECMRMLKGKRGKQ